MQNTTNIITSLRTTWGWQCCKLLCILVFILFSNAYAAENEKSANDVFVKGYIKSDGTYVAPHYRSSPDSKVNNNWSTKGNVNPYTGSEGTKKREFETGFSGPDIISPHFDKPPETNTVSKSVTIKPPQSPLVSQSNTTDYRGFWIGLIIVAGLLFLIIQGIRDAITLFNEDRKAFYFDAAWLSGATILLIALLLSAL